MDAGRGTQQDPQFSETSVAPEDWPLHGLGERAKRDRATVLVVDDDRDVRDILSHYFTAKGYDVETLETAEGIFGTLERARPDVVLLDLMLPGEDGRAVLDRLRASPSWSRLPVIMITACHDTGTLLPLREGTDGWFEKPLDLSALLASVERIVHGDDGQLTQSARILR
jgi:DNA-binding response OmpR family regulator